MSIFIPRRTKQPGESEIIGHQEIDWSNKYAPYLDTVLFPVNNGLLDLVTGEKQVINGDVTITDQGFVFPGQVGSYMTLPNTSFDETDTAHSCVMRATVEAGGGSYPFLIGRGTTGSTEWMFRTVNQITSYYAASGNHNAVSLSNTVIYDEEADFAFSVEDSVALAPDVYTYKDGEQTASDVTHDSPRTSGFDVEIGGTSHASNRYFKGKIKHLILLKGLALDSEAQADLHQNPGQILKPRRRFWALAAVAGGANSFDTIFDGLNLIADGSLLVSGVATSALESLSLDGQGEALSSAVGSMAATTDNLSLAADGSIDITAALSTIFGDITLTADGGVYVAGSFLSTLNDLMLDGNAAGIASTAGSFNSTLDSLSINGDGSIDIAAALAATLDGVTMLGDGQVDVIAIGSINLDGLTLDGSAAGGAITLGDYAISLEGVSINGDGGLDTVGGLDVSIGGVGLNADGQVDLTGAATTALDGLTVFGSNASLAVTPDGRVYIVLADNRSFAIGRDDRSFNVH